VNITGVPTHGLQIDCDFSWNEQYAGPKEDVDGYDVLKEVGIEVRDRIQREAWLCRIAGI
jgi:hypothetical protein